MKFDHREIRSAMDRRLSALDADPLRRERVRRRIIQEEEPIVKKKLTVGLVFAIVTVLALTGVALAVGVNLFEFFGKRDTRYAEIAPQASLNAEAPVSIDSQALGVTTATINTAYFDGESLLVGYILQNNSRIEPFTPTDEFLSRMEKSESKIYIAASSDEEAAFFKQYTEATENGTPFGFVQYSVYPSDHTETDDGIDLPPRTETEETAPDGARYVLREYETPLPEALQNREALNIRIRLWQNTFYLYFDGENYFTLSEGQQEAGAMTATVSLTDAETKHYSGSGTFGGADIAVHADASSVWAKIEITASSDAFPPLSDDAWYDLILMDERGHTLRVDECGSSDSRTLTASCEGTGKVPESLTAYVLTRTEGEWDLDAAIKAATPILLTLDD